jgi:exopolyphosphatase/pppGpp-phosphohydrolase
MMRKAVIDLGTNTFNLLIADVREKGFELIHSEKDGVALGMGGINQGYLSEEAFERGIVTLTHFKNTVSNITLSKFMRLALLLCVERRMLMNSFKKYVEILVLILRSFPVFGRHN